MILVKESTDSQKNNKAHSPPIAAVYETPESKTTNGFCLEILWWVLCLVCGVCASYAVYQMIQTYRSEPISSMVSMMVNDTFEWPTATFCLHEDLCYNQTAVQEIMEQNNLKPNTKAHKKNKKGRKGPFEFTSDFDYVRYSEYILDSRYHLKENIIIRCEYSVTDRYGETSTVDCDRSKVGTWKSYETPGGTCHSFTSKPATDVQNSISFFLNFKLCSQVYVIIHSAPDIFYDIITPYMISYTMGQEGARESFVNVQEFNRVNRKIKPCEENPDYSQATCQHIATMKYYIAEQGCNVPVLTGLSSFKDYPICNDSSSVFYFTSNIRFMTDINKLHLPKQLQDERNKCLERCQKKIYKQEKSKSHTYKNPDNSSIFKMSIPEDGMLFYRIEEQFDLDFTTLLSNIGGTLGIFLGVSILSIVDILSMMHNLMKKLGKKFQKHKVGNF